MRNLLRVRDLLLVDCTQDGVDFFLAEDTTELSAIDFKSLKPLSMPAAASELAAAAFDADNLFARLEPWQQLWDVLRKRHRQPRPHTQVVFLLNPRSSDLEKQLLRQVLPFYQQVSFVSRYFFYHFLIKESRNFSKHKLLIQPFSHAAELSFFDDERLLRQETVAVPRLLDEAALFLDAARTQAAPLVTDCFYLLSNHHRLADAQIEQLSQALKLEAVLVETVC